MWLVAQMLADWMLNGSGIRSCGLPQYSSWPTAAGQSCFINNMSDKDLIPHCRRQLTWNTVASLFYFWLIPPCYCVDGFAACQRQKVVWDLTIISSIWWIYPLLPSGDPSCLSGATFGGVSEAVFSKLRPMVSGLPDGLLFLISFIAFGTTKPCGLLPSPQPNLSSFVWHDGYPWHEFTHTMTPHHSVGTFRPLSLLPHGVPWSHSKHNGL